MHFNLPGLNTFIGELNCSSKVYVVLMNELRFYHTRNFPKAISMQILGSAGSHGTPGVSLANALQVRYCDADAHIEYSARNAASSAPVWDRCSIHHSQNRKSESCIRTEEGCCKPHRSGVHASCHWPVNLAGVIAVGRL